MAVQVLPGKREKKKKGMNMRENHNRLLNKELVEDALCSVTNLSNCYCKAMADRIASSDGTSNEMSFEMANAVSAMGKLMSVLYRMMEANKKSDADDQRPIPEES